MKRLLLLIIFLVLPASLIFSDQDNGAIAQVSVQPETRVETLLTQDVSYDLGFLWLDEVAIADFKLTRGDAPDLYIASLSARTLGIAATLTGNRQHRYESLMRLMPDGSFRSERHTSQIEKRGVIRTKIYRFDYEKKEVGYQYSKNGKMVDEKVLSIDGEVLPGDVLTIYFNLVAGVYGPMEVGAHYEVPAFNKKGTGSITIDFLPSKERPKKSFFGDDLLICRVQVDQEIFDTKDGVVFIGYNGKRLPERGIVADILGIGDVRGVMK